MTGVGCLYVLLEMRCELQVYCAQIYLTRWLPVFSPATVCAACVLLCSCSLRCYCDLVCPTILTLLLPQRCVCASSCCVLSLQVRRGAKCIFFCLERYRTYLLAKLSHISFVARRTAEHAQVPTSHLKRLCSSSHQFVTVTVTVAPSCRAAVRKSRWS